MLQITYYNCKSVCLTKTIIILKKQRFNYYHFFSWVSHFFSWHLLMTHPSTKFDFWHVPLLLGESCTASVDKNMQGTRRMGYIHADVYIIPIILGSAMRLHTSPCLAFRLQEAGR